MFEVKPINVGEKPNNGDLFEIKLSRKELGILEAVLNQHADHEPVNSMWAAIYDRIR